MWISVQSVADNKNTVWAYGSAGGIPMHPLLMVKDLCAVQSTQPIPKYLFIPTSKQFEFDKFSEVKFNDDK